MFIYETKVSVALDNAFWSHVGSMIDDDLVMFLFGEMTITRLNQLPFMGWSQEQWRFHVISPMIIWGWVKTLVTSEPQNSLDLWMWITH